jgi:hypothetical protein
MQFLFEFDAISSRKKIENWPCQDKRHAKRDFESTTRITSLDVARVFTLPLAGGSDAVAAGEGNARSKRV